MGLGEGGVGLTDVEEVRAEAADEHFEDDLEEGAEDEGVQRAEDGVVAVPEAADADLGEDDDADGDEGRDEARRGGRDDPAAIGVGPLWVDDVAGFVKGDGEVADGRGGGLVDLGCVSGDRLEGHGAVA